MNASWDSQRIARTVLVIAIVLLERLDAVALPRRACLGRRACDRDLAAAPNSRPARYRKHCGRISADAAARGGPGSAAHLAGHSGRPRRRRRHGMGERRPRTRPGHARLAARHSLHRQFARRVVEGESGRARCRAGAARPQRNKRDFQPDAHRRSPGGEPPDHSGVHRAHIVFSLPRRPERHGTGAGDRRAAVRPAGRTARQGRHRRRARHGQRTGAGRTGRRPRARHRLCGSPGFTMWSCSPLRPACWRPFRSARR